MSYRFRFYPWTLKVLDSVLILGLVPAAVVAQTNDEAVPAPSPAPPKQQEVTEDQAVPEASEPRPLLPYLNAGYDNAFFVADQDENFRLDVGGRMQVRFLANFRDNPPDNEDGTTTGFQFRRFSLDIAVRLADPELRLLIRPTVERNSGRVSMEDLWVSYNPTDELTLRLGNMKMPFTRETLLSSRFLQTVERSYVNTLLGFFYSTGVDASYDAGDFRFTGMFSDGVGSDIVGFGNSRTDYALTGRVDARVLGDWEYRGDFSGYQNYEPGLFLGAAAHHEAGNTDAVAGDTFPAVDFFAWTIDASLYAQNIGIYTAAIGRHTTRAASGARHHDDVGWLLQGGYMIDDEFEPYARYELIIPDGSRDAHNINLITAGFNWYIRGHRLKWSNDVVWALNSISGFAGASDGLGLLDDRAGERHQVLLRTQLQLLF